MFLGLRWHAVASWTWDAQDETCGICRMAFDGCCSDCKLPGDDCPLSKPLVRVVIFGNTVMIVCHNVDSLFSSLKEFLADAMPFNSSYLSVPNTVSWIHECSLFMVWGACNHAFHLHCILKWVNSQTSQAHCPMCRREWQFKG
ncbi:Anaphase-promoting complex subunit 11 [Hibiscus syriacus]|uniref:Anaphase-promoting complex subunit 11 n=1 Tax=Hibiscus syriacus TaxID=106335 RepID=A0A6A3B2R4_HIBSY|nr:Anaphase-promoting complex subunit 11 [Hibiscus syriacus]